MSNPLSVRECDVFTKARKTSSRLAKTTPSAGDTEANSMASVAEVLTELKALRSEFGSKLDGIDNRLGDLANSVTVLENKLADIKGDVTANRKCIEEAEARILAAEEKLDKTESALASATKRLVYLEAKMDDLENRARRKNVRVFGLKEGAEGSRPLLDFVQDMLPKWLDLGSDRSFILERVHRTLAPARPNHNRAVLIRFLKFQDKEFVLRTTRQQDITYDGTKLSFAQDLSAETIRRRREFDGVKKFFIDMGTFRGFHHHP
ncbi:hypothetical protein SRHO_G00113000 [Serrasalmus rhombeus]